jgi:hypothetical protein
MNRVLTLFILQTDLGFRIAPDNRMRFTGGYFLTDDDNSINSN